MDSPVAMKQQTHRNKPWWSQKLSVNAVRSEFTSDASASTKNTLGKPVFAALHTVSQMLPASSDHHPRGMQISLLYRQRKPFRAKSVPVPKPQTFAMLLLSGEEKPFNSIHDATNKQL